MHHRDRFLPNAKVRTPFPFWTGNCPLSLALQLCRPITAGQVIQNDKRRRRRMSPSRTSRIFLRTKILTVNAKIKKNVLLFRSLCMEIALRVNADFD